MYSCCMDVILIVLVASIVSISFYYVHKVKYVKSTQRHKLQVHSLSLFLLLCMFLVIVSYFLHTPIHQCGGASSNFTLHEAMTYVDVLEPMF